MRLRITDCGADFAETEVVVGGTLSNHKGVNVPQAVLPISAITEKDRADLSFALAHGADWIALSFVQRPDDVAEGRKLVGNAAGIMVKLEKPAALGRLDEIIELADALMVARGDLGVEMPPEDVPTRAEAADPRLPARRQAGHRRDADARIDGRRADADARRGLRCRDRRL